MTSSKTAPEIHQALDENVLRAGFLRKVYGLLTAQMVFTVGVAALCMASPSISRFCLSIATSQTSWFMWATLIPSIGSLLLLNLGVKNSYPANYILLFIFTLSNSIQLGFVCAVVEAAGYGHLVLQAFTAATIIFSGLTLYTLYSGKDFSFMGGFLSVALWALVLTGIVGIIFPWMVHSLAYGFVGALTFSGYIIYDTWRLQKQFSYDDYIGATIELYLDIVNLFLYILRILLELQKTDKKKDDKK